MPLPSKTLWILLAGLGAGLPLAALGLFGLGPPTPEGQPFELRREKHSRANWNTGGRTEYWTYQARWRGKGLRFSAPAHRYPGDPGPDELFDHCNEGWGLGRGAASGSGDRERVAAEALLLNVGYDPNNAPRWFLVRERAGKLEATWLATTPSDDPSVWQVWGPGQPRRPGPGDSEVYAPMAEAGLVPLRRWVAGLTLPAADPPRYLLVGNTALVEVATRRVFPLPESDRAGHRNQPLGLSPDGRSFLFLAGRGLEESLVEQVLLDTGESRVLVLDWTARHARHSLDLGRAWLEAALEWREEAPGGPAWARWREGARYPIWTGRLAHDGRTSHYELEGYGPGILAEAVALLTRDLQAKARPASRQGLDPGEEAHDLTVDGAALRLGWNGEHGLYLYATGNPGPAEIGRADAAVGRVAAAIDGALRAGRWQDLVAPRGR